MHHINLDGTTLADIERDALHRPVERTIGKLNTQFQLDPLGRLKQQIVQPNSHNKADPAVLIGRRYQYDTIGNLIRTDDQTNGSRDYTYDALGRISQSADEHYRYDPAHNLTDGSRIGGNRITQYKGISYRYDPIGRRIAKVHPDGGEIQYLWDGSRLLQEYSDKATYTYVYTEQGSYEPLAQIVQMTNTDNNKVGRQILYYHNDQIGIPREMTDEEGNIVWSGDYSGWGKLTQESRLKLDIHQPFRLQNQYYDEETGLHYNFFRYYDPEIGRFTQQDPIRLAGGESLYRFAPNVMGWQDALGLEAKYELSLWEKAKLMDETLVDRATNGSMTKDLVNFYTNNVTLITSATAVIPTPEWLTKAKPNVSTTISGVAGTIVSAEISLLDAEKAPDYAMATHFKYYQRGIAKCEKENGKKGAAAMDAYEAWNTGNKKKAIEILQKNGCIADSHTKELGNFFRKK